MTEASPRARHLYVHVPFCAHRCGYCAFVTAAESPELHTRYVQALVSEQVMRSGPIPHRYDTIYIGGGTPTILGGPAMDLLLEFVDGWAAPDAEITIECNPETVDPRLCRQLADGPVTRVSVGAQSTNERVLSVLERRAAPAQIAAAVSDLRAAGVSNLGLDFIWGVPGQDTHDIAADLDFVRVVEPEHVSSYELEFKEGTRIAHAHPGAGRVLEHTDELFDAWVDGLESLGYRWYEISNFARPRFECRHNIGYWELAGWDAIGVGAVAAKPGIRRTNTPGIHRYLDALEAESLPPQREETISASAHLEEALMLAARRDEPVDLRRFEPIIDTDALIRLESHGLIATDDEAIRISRRGRMLLNSLLVELVAETATADAGR